MSKIQETLNKGLQYFKYNKNDPFEGIKMMEQIVFSHYLFVSESIDDYLIGKRSIKRKWIVLILQLCIWIYLLKSLFISYYNNRAFSIMTGDFFYLYPRPDILNVTVFSIFTALAITGENNFSFVGKSSI